MAKKAKIPTVKPNEWRRSGNATRSPFKKLRSRSLPSPTGNSAALLLTHPLHFSRSVEAAEPGHVVAESHDVLLLPRNEPGQIRVLALVLKIRNEQMHGVFFKRI